MTNQKQDTVAVNLSSFLTPVAILLSGLVIAGGLFFGLNGNTSNKGKVLPTQEALPQAQAPAPEEENPKAKTSIDDDAIMGDKETAKIAIVEFSDFECPFCTQFRKQTLDDIKENYVDTGKAIFVYRDLPLGFHDPAATREANAAECARTQGGDEVYYQFHDEIFEQTPGNGDGISEEDLVLIGVDLGLDKAKLTKCIKDQDFIEEVQKDALDAGQAGISGTPGFVIGKLDKDGNVDGVVVKGAQPYSSFERTIEEQLGN